VGDSSHPSAPSVSRSATSRLPGRVSSSHSFLFAASGLPDPRPVPNHSPNHHPGCPAVWGGSPPAAASSVLYRAVTSTRPRLANGDLQQQPVVARERAAMVSNRDPAAEKSCYTYSARGLDPNSSFIRVYCRDPAPRVLFDSARPRWLVSHHSPPRASGKSKSLGWWIRPLRRRLCCSAGRGCTLRLSAPH
jgi:hypothetical protein